MDYADDVMALAEDDIIEVEWGKGVNGVVFVVNEFVILVGIVAGRSCEWAVHVCS